jgi:hypothetical protein
MPTGPLPVQAHRLKLALAHATRAVCLPFAPALRRLMPTLPMEVEGYS